MAVSKRVREAGKRVDEALRTRDFHVPYECRPTLESLTALGTPWADETRRELARRCYIELGFEVLGAHIPRMQYACAPQVRKVIDGVRRHDLRDPKLALLIERATRQCP